MHRGSQQTDLTGPAGNCQSWWSRKAHLGQLEVRVTNRHSGAGKTTKGRRPESFEPGPHTLQGKAADHRRSSERIIRCATRGSSCSCLFHWHFLYLLCLYRTGTVIRVASRIPPPRYFVLNLDHSNPDRATRSRSPRSDTRQRRIY